MDASEALLLSERNRDYDGNCGLGGGVFLWIIVLVLIFFAFGWGRNGFGNNGTDNNGLVAALAAQGRTQDLSQVERDVLQTSCATQKEILESRYTTQLGFQQAQAQVAQCCCDLKTAIAEDGEKTRALIQGNTIQALRDANEAKDREILLYQVTSQNINQTQNLLSALIPRPIPAYITCSPYMSAYYGAYGFGNGCQSGCCNG